MTKINSIGGGNFGSIVEGRICRTHKLCGGFLLLLSLTLVSCGGGSGGGGSGGGGGSVATPLATLGISNFTFTPAPDSITLSWTNPTNSSRAISKFNISIAGYSSKSASTAMDSNSSLVDYGGDGMTQTASFTNLNAALHYEVLFRAIYTDGNSSDAINALAGTLLPRRALGVNTDGDGVADAEDIDDDNDGRLDDADNCPLVANPDQADNDGDYDPNDRVNPAKGGDICDNDDDNDGQPDTIDNCPLLLGGNTNQADNDNDYDANDRANRNRGGDACDEDDDNDGQLDDADNCPLVANPDQADTDNDYDPNDRANPAKGGDSCDNDDDNDGIADTADVDDNGDGLIEISTHEQFNMIRHNLAGTNLTSTAGGGGDASGCVRVDSSRTPCYGYELTADISLASYPNWVPIGTCVANDDCPTSNSFSGVFDGNNHSISNLTIAISSESYGVGLFGAITSAAILRNLTLMNVNISSTSSGSDFGSLVGYGRGASILDVRAVNVTIGVANVDAVGGLLGDGQDSTVSSSSVVAHSISGSTSVGGLIGGGESSTVSSSSVVAHSISGSSNSVGGLIGGGESSTVSSSSVVAHSISGSSFNVGGLLGWGQSSTVSSSSVVAHSISGSSFNVGGLLGWGQSSTVSSSSVVAHSISGSSLYVGGLLGRGQSSTISSSLVLGGSLNGTSHVGGIVGASGVINNINSNPRDVSNSYWSIVFTDAQPNATTNTFGESKSVTEIQSPTTFTGIYADWANGWCDPATGEFTTSPTHSLATAGGGDTYRVWDLGSASEYPVIRCFGDRLTPAQQRAATTRVLDGDGGDGGGSVAAPLATLGISNFTFTPSPASITLRWTNPTNPPRAISQFNISIAGYSSKSASTAEYSDSRLFDYGGDGVTQTASFANLNADLHYEVLFQAIYTDDSSSSAIDALAGALFPRRAIGVNTDGDGFADADDTDDDNDGRLDTRDNCPLLLGGNTNQADNDDDGFAADARTNANKGGDICDADDDNDGRLDDADNCPLLLGGNINQADNDNDGFDADARTNANKGGDICDTDDDNDGTNDIADVDDNGNGLIEISTHEQFNMIRHNLAGTNLTSTAGGDGDASGCVRVASRVDSNRTPCYGYELTADISLASYSNWVPIGTCVANIVCPISFSGVFDGNNHSISNLTIAISSVSYGVGLFGSITSAAILRNLTLMNVTISSTSSGNDFGSLVGYGRGASILDVRAVNVTIDAADVGAVGGLFGDGQSSTVSSSSVVAHSISGSNSVGGLMGWGQSSTISSSPVVANSISGGSFYVGGLLGWGQSSTVSSSSVVAHSISGSGDYVGGLLGWGDSSTVSSSSVVAHSISGSSDYVGGLLGFGENAPVSSSSVVAHSISGFSSVGGLIGDGQSSTVSSSSVVAHSISGFSSVGGLLGFGRSSIVSSSLVLGGSLNGTSRVGGIVGASGGASRDPRDVSNSYWLDSIVFTDARQLSTNRFGENKSVTEIQSPIEFSGIYADWANGWCDPATGSYTTNSSSPLAIDANRVWDLGSASEYPAMTCFGNRLTPAQQRTATTKVLNDESPLPLSP